MRIMDFFRSKSTACGNPCMGGPHAGEPPLSSLLKGRDPWNLDFPLFQWSKFDAFTLRNAVESVAIFGELGAAKTTGL